LKKPEDWYRVSRTQIENLGGRAIFYRGSLYEALAIAYPNQKWDTKKFAMMGKKSAQRWLLIQLKKVLPRGTELVEEFRHPLINYSGDAIAAKMQIDIWIPDFNLAIEYHGEQHYHNITGFGPSGTLAVYENRDSLKKQITSQQNIRFLTIPYWWDRQSESLAATLHMKFPDIFPESGNGTPIPSDVPPFTRKRNTRHRSALEFLILQQKNTTPQIGFRENE